MALHHDGFRSRLCPEMPEWLPVHRQRGLGVMHYARPVSPDSARPEDRAMTPRLARFAAAASLAASCALATVPAQAATTAPASATAPMKAPPTVGNFYVSAPHTPRTAKIGARPLSFTIHLRQDSRYHVAISVYLGWWAWTTPGLQQTRGVTVRWLNPENGQWEKPCSVDHSGDFYLGPTDLGLVLAKNQVVQIPVRMWFGPHAKQGTYHLTPGVAWWEVFNSSGQSFPAVLGEVPADGNTYLVHVRR